MEYIKDFRFLPTNSREKLTPIEYFYLVAFEDGYDRSVAKYLTIETAIINSKYRTVTKRICYQYIFSKLLSYGFLVQQPGRMYSFRPTKKFAGPLKVKRVGDISEYNFKTSSKKM